MLSRISLALFATSTFLTPLQFSLAQAQDSSTKSCLLVTEVNSAGKVVWSENADVAGEVDSAKFLEISPFDYQTLCRVGEIFKGTTPATAVEENTTETEQESAETTKERKLVQEANTGACSIMTIVSDAGEITWNTDEAAAELISIAKETNLTPEQAHEACHGEAVTQQAEAEEAVEAVEAVEDMGL